MLLHEVRAGDAVAIREDKVVAVCLFDCAILYGALSKSVVLMPNVLDFKMSARSNSMDHFTRSLVRSVIRDYDFIG